MGKGNIVGGEGEELICSFGFCLHLLGKFRNPDDRLRRKRSGLCNLTKIEFRIKLPKAGTGQNWVWAPQ